MRTINYSIKQAIFSTPEISLPRGSQVVSVKHHDAYTQFAPYPEESSLDIPECWQVVWLEPKKGK